MYELGGMLTMEHEIISYIFLSNLQSIYFGKVGFIHLY
jgi:hypothetical protein